MNRDSTLLRELFIPGVDAARRLAGTS